MTTFQILQFTGLSVVFPTIVTLFVNTIINNVGKQKKDSESLRLGIQALLRAQMIKDWNKYSEMGYAPLYARENFENVWQQYHNLGANGVMDDIHSKFLALPTREN